MIALLYATLTIRNIQYWPGLYYISAPINRYTYGQEISSDLITFTNLSFELGYEGRKRTLKLPSADGNKKYLFIEAWSGNAEKYIINAFSNGYGSFMKNIWIYNYSYTPASPAYGVKVVDMGVVHFTSISYCVSTEANSKKLYWILEFSPVYFESFFIDAYFDGTQDFNQVFSAMLLTGSELLDLPNTIPIDLSSRTMVQNGAIRQLTYTEPTT